MTLKENSNGNCFADWLQEYKTRLQEVHLQGCLANGEQANGQVASDSNPDQQANDNAPSSPARAGETCSLRAALVA